jgi:thiol:disulfide interchange protein
MVVFAGAFVLILLVMLVLAVWFLEIDLDSLPGMAGIFLLVPALGAGTLTVSLSETDRSLIIACVATIVIAIIVAALILRGRRKSPGPADKPTEKR